jgi:hypothetical protein
MGYVGAGRCARRPRSRVTSHKWVYPHWVLGEETRRNEHATEDRRNFGWAGLHAGARSGGLALDGRGLRGKMLSTGCVRAIEQGVDDRAGTTARKLARWSALLGVRQLENLCCGDDSPAGRVVAGGHTRRVLF